MEKVWIKNYPKGIPAEINPDRYASIPEVFLESCKKFENHMAFTNMGEGITYAKLEKLTRDFAAYLQSDLGLKKGDRIAIQMPNVLQYPVAMFGALRAGLTVVNTNPLYTPREMEHQFKDSGAKALVILANMAHNLEEILPLIDIKHVIVTEIGDLFRFPKNLVVNAAVKYVKKMVPPFSIPGATSFNQALKRGATLGFQDVPIEGKDLAFLQYTGGTTGVSKGAMLTHRNILSNMDQALEWMKPRLEEGRETIITALPLYHVFSLTVNCLTFIKFGACDVLITNPRDIPGFIKELERQPFTVLTGVNTLFTALMNHPEFKKVDFSKLKLSVAGAMALQSAVSERWRRETGTIIIEGYGLTEASPIVCCNPVDGSDRVGTIGMPVPSTEIKICGEDDQELPTGESGEICVKGPQVMQGYWNRPDETAGVLKGGWLHTGDIGFVSNDGFIKIVDRKKDMILVSGFNVYPNEVEDVIAAHPGVLEVAAVGVPDAKSGETVKIFVVKRNPDLTAEDVLKFAKERLTGYKMPRQIEFRAELPKTNVGKILRRALRNEAKANVPGPT